MLDAREKLAQKFGKMQIGGKGSKRRSKKSSASSNVPNIMTNPYETKFDSGVSDAQSMLEMMSMFMPPEAKKKM